MAGNHDSPVFSYQTRVAVTAEQDSLLREYARLFGHVERTLFADLQRGKDAGQLKSEYLARFSITARQFNALRIQLLGKISAIRELIPLRIENLKTKIRKAKRVVRKLAKCLPGSKQLHYKRRRSAGLEQRLERLKREQKTGQVHLCFGSKRLFHAQFHREENGFPSRQEWKQAWTEARSRQFFIIGSKDVGAVNFAARYGISVHQGAAIAIARRSLNLSERPAKRMGPVPVRGGGHVTLLLPARNRSRHVWSLWAKIARQIRAAHVAHIQLLPRKAGSTPGPLCCQAQCAT
jgi:hypothetical protein